VLFNQVSSLFKAHHPSRRHYWRGMGRKRRRHARIIRRPILPWLCQDREPGRYLQSVLPDDAGSEWRVTILILRT